MAQTLLLKSYRAASNNEFPVDDTLIDSYILGGTLWLQFNWQGMNSGRLGRKCRDNIVVGRKYEGD